MPARYRLLPRRMPRHPRRGRRTQDTDAGAQAARPDKASDYPCCCGQLLTRLAHGLHQCNATPTQKPRNTAQDTGNGPPWSRRHASPARQPGHRKGAGQRVLNPTRQTHGDGTSPHNSSPDQGEGNVTRGGQARRPGTTQAKHEQALTFLATQNRLGPLALARKS